MSRTPHHSKRHQFALTTLFLVCGFTTTTQVLSPVWAQPKNDTALLKTASLSEENKAQIKKLEAQVFALSVASTPISLSVTDATVQQVVEKIVTEIKKKLPESLPIEVRKANEIQVTFSAKDKSVGQMLKAIAVLAETDVHVLPDRIVIGPSDSLTKAESESRTSWSLQAYASHQVQLRLKYAALVVKELDRQKVTRLSYENFSPDHQRLLQAIATQMTQGTEDMNLALTADTQIEVTDKPSGNFTLVMTFGSQRRQVRLTNYRRNG